MRWQHLFNDKQGFFSSHYPTFIQQEFYVGYIIIPHGFQLHSQETSGFWNVHMQPLARKNSFHAWWLLRCPDFCPIIHPVTRQVVVISDGFDCISQLRRGFIRKNVNINANPLSVHHGNSCPTADSGSDSLAFRVIRHKPVVRFSKKTPDLFSAQFSLCHLYTFSR